MSVTLASQFMSNLCPIPNSYAEIPAFYAEDFAIYANIPSLYADIYIFEFHCAGNIRGQFPCYLRQNPFFKR